MPKGQKSRTALKPNTLFAWAAPAFIDPSPFDHTWVTNFPLDKTPTELEKVRKKDLYWYCYGDLRLQGRLLATQVGTPQQSSCCVKPNVRSQEDDAAKGTIFKYGRHGVCHQVANQVLFSTGIKSPPITVQGARGYWDSTFLYGTYGKNLEDWETLKQRCSTK